VTWGTASGSSGASHVAGIAKADGRRRRSNTCLIFINQIREKIGVMFGSPETTTGGRALKFYSSVSSTFGASVQSRMATAWSAAAPK
jgi:hypothetical protein